MKIGCVARLNETNSIHTQTFKRAIELCSEWLSQSPSAFVPASGSRTIELLMFDDEASAEGSAKAVEKVLREKIDAVVGHFASASAQFAAPVYESHNIPLFLPAATATDVTRHRTTYRLCDNDDDYARYLVEYSRTHGFTHADIRHDGSFYGESISRRVNELWQKPASTNLGAEKVTRQATLYAGRYFMSVRFLKELMQNTADANSEQIVFLTDDALSPALCDEELPLNCVIYIGGMEPQIKGALAQAMRDRYVARWKQMPGTYFWETVAAVQVAIQSANKDPLSETWDTVIGPITFEKDREARINSFGMWQLYGRQLKKIESKGT